MLSLANTYSKEEIEDFITRIQKLLGKKILLFRLSSKWMELPSQLPLKKGFVPGVTRGDGRRGDDITANMRTIGTFPCTCMERYSRFYGSEGRSVYAACHFSKVK